MPSIIDGLFAGRAGIQSHGIAISVIADNISNQNTVGFKAGRADFKDLLAGSLGSGGATSTGSGSSAGSITRILSQGTFEFTGRGLDLGIDGNGFIVLESETGQKSYTRAGNLQVDPEGDLLDQNGLYVLGYLSGGSGTLERINVNSRVSGDIGTTEIELTGNLDASAPILPALTGPFTYASLSANSSYQQQISTFDSLGAEHTINAYFVKTGANTWSAHFFANSNDVTVTPTQPAANTPVQLANSPIALVYGSSGQLTLASPAGTANLGPVQWSNGSSPSTFETNLRGFTQFSSPSTTDSISQNGTGSGSVTGFSVSKDGTLFAKLDNGQNSSIGIIALASFANAEGLARSGNSLFNESIDSGEPVFGRPSVGTFGAIQSGALELSTSDLAADFIKLISLQRGYQGSSRIVSSINDLLTEIVNLAR